MSKIFDNIESTFISFSQDICSRIDSSALSKRLNRLKPPNADPPKTLIQPNPAETAHHARSSTSRIIPELRAVVDVLKARLNSTKALKNVSRPCTRIKPDPREVLSPGKYHHHTSSTGGFGFGKSPRLHDSIDHQINGIF
jgi:hypothetical protein